MLLQLAGPLMLTQHPQICGEVVGREQGVGVLLPEHPTAVAQGVLVELAGPLILPQRMQIGGEVVGRVQGVGVVLPSRSSRPVNTTNRAGMFHTRPTGIPADRARANPLNA